MFRSGSGERQLHESSREHRTLASYVQSLLPVMRGSREKIKDPMKKIYSSLFDPLFGPRAKFLSPSLLFSRFEQRELRDRMR